VEKAEAVAKDAVKNVQEGLGKMVLNLKASTAKIGDMVKQAGANVGVKKQPSGPPTN
jgi:hypothetical protein